MIAHTLPLLLGLGLLTSARAAQAQPSRAPQAFTQQPVAQQPVAQPTLAQQRLAGKCPLVVPANQSELQPMRIAPSQVAAKNARGCLSAADAIYGPDGCPLRLCGRNSGVIQLPEP